MPSTTVMDAKPGYGEQNQFLHNFENVYFCCNVAEFHKEVDRH